MFFKNISILQSVPVFAAGILFAGIGMFLYLFVTTRKQTHLAMFLLSLLSFVFVMSEMLLVTFGAVFDNAELSAQFHRIEQISGSYFLFILPYFLYHYLQPSRTIHKISKYFAFTGLGIAFLITCVAFIQPDLFVSVTELRRPHWLIEVGSIRRGVEGPLYLMRDILLGVTICYCIFLLIFHVIRKKNLRYVTSIFIGVAVGVFSAVEDIVHVYIGRHIDFFQNIEGSRFPIGVSLFVFCSMISVFRRYVDQDNELKHAYGQITESRSRLKELNESLAKSLEEKELLLKEIHHRVKNNLQIVASLLYLQSERIDSPSIEHYFIESQSRINAMALIHEHFYSTEQLTDIDFDDYLQELVMIIFETYNEITNNVISRIAVPRIHVPLQSAIPLGLIVNELVTNALVHGFEREDEGVIEIVLEKQDDFYTLTIRDNGKGLPNDFDINKESSLGLSLVSSLCRQLKGTFSLLTDKGTVAVIQFKSTTLAMKASQLKRRVP